MTTEDWSLSEEQRDETISRIRTNIATMAFFRSTPLPPDVVAAAAAAVEKKAYIVARVEARTTTGMRPHHETLKAYVRKLSELVLEVVASGAQSIGPAVQTDDTFLDLTGSREFLTHETAEELLAPMLSPDSKISKIKFSTKSFGIEAAQVAARAIINIAPSLTHADMSDIIAGRPEDEALAALRIISEALKVAKLKHLDLSDNALGEKGIRACAAAFSHQETLESIAFQNVGCSVHGCAAVDELLQSTASLKRLHLLNNMSGDEGAVSISNVLRRSPAMEDFKMASSRVGAVGGTALAQALASPSSGGALLSLDIHDNPLTEEAASDIGRVLLAHKKLKRVNLNDICLGDDGIEIVSKSLAAGAPVLEDLSLDLNEMTPVGAEALATTLAVKKTLLRLSLRENELEDDGASHIARGISGLTALQVIDLTTNQIKRGGACAIAKAVGNKSNFKSLELDDNEISDAGVDALKAILKRIGKLGALGSLDENMPDGDEDEDGYDEGHEVVDGDVDALANELAGEVHL